MLMNLMDRSFYLKGLLLLVKKDGNIYPEEKEMLMRLGRLLQFNEEFCETAIRDLLQNDHIKDFELKFSNEECAKVFLKDGIKMAFADNSLHVDEYNWLKQIAMANNISDTWLSFQLSSFLNSKDLEDKKRLEIRKYFGKIAVTPAKQLEPKKEPAGAGNFLPLEKGLIGS